jgi:hypothetical protein
VSKCINKIPAGLPDLPPVPAGWDAWEYMGLAWKSPSEKSPWTHYQPSVPHEGWLFGGDLSYEVCGSPSGCSDGYYIRAVKHPAKPKRVRKAKATPTKIPGGIEFSARHAKQFINGNHEALRRAFFWAHTPQGWGFWADIYHNHGRAKVANGVAIVREWMGLPSPKPTTRREPRVSRIATVIQRAISGQIPTAMDGAREVERIYDNSQRAIRRKREGGK